MFVYISNVRAAAEMFNSGTITVTQMGIFLSVDLHLCKKKTIVLQIRAKFMYFIEGDVLLLPTMTEMIRLLELLIGKKKSFWFYFSLLLYVKIMSYFYLETCKRLYRKSINLLYFLTLKSCQQFPCHKIFYTFFYFISLYIL